jgi:hypothetical protein
VKNEAEMKRQKEELNRKIKEWHDRQEAEKADQQAKKEA